MKTSLIMEGGAMRGMFTCGVIDVLLDNHITFDGAAGISAGAVFGCNFKSKQIGRALRYNKRYSKDKRYMSLWSLVTTGDLFGKEFCYHTLPEKLDLFDTKTFEENPMPFYVGASNVATGKIEYHNCLTGTGEDIEWMRASASMPGASHPVEINGNKYLDGGIVEPVPYRFMENLGYDRNLVILTQPKGFRKEKSRGMRLLRPILRKYPEILSAMEIRHIKYNTCIDYVLSQEAQGKALILCPPEPLDISRTEKDPKELERVYQIGCQTAQLHLQEIRSFLEP